MHGRASSSPWEWEFNNRDLTAFQSGRERKANTSKSISIDSGKKKMSYSHAISYHFHFKIIFIKITPNQSFLRPMYLLLSESLSRQNILFLFFSSMIDWHLPSDLLTSLLLSLNSLSLLFPLLPFYLPLLSLSLFLPFTHTYVFSLDSV